MCYILVFQFHKGAIRTKEKYGKGCCIPPFQFHKGAIRTLILFDNFFGKILFQFHKGAIRTPLRIIPLRVHLYFNSIKVRLEHSGKEGWQTIREFQFHKGAIRT